MTEWELADLFANSKIRSRGSLHVRLLIVRTGAMGDILHGLPALAALRLCQPESYLAWAVEPHWKPLLANDTASTRGLFMPIVDRIHEVPTRRWKQRSLSPSALMETLREISHLRGEMAAGQYDVCVDLQGTLRSAVIARLSGAKRVLGPKRPRERPAALFYGERVEFHGAHVIQHACELLAAALNQEHALCPAKSSLPIDPTAETWAETTLRRLEADDRKRFVLIAPTAGWGAKEWSPENYKSVAAALHKAGFPVLVNAAAQDDPAAARIAAAGDATVVPSDLSQLIALTRRAALVIGGDTGPVHLAAALARPVLALFGPTDPKRNGPEFPGARTYTLRHASSRVERHRGSETERGLGRITVEEVTRAALEMLQAEARTMHG